MAGVMFEDGDGRRWTVKTVNGGSTVMLEASEGDEDDGDLHTAELYIPRADLGRLRDAIEYIERNSPVPKPAFAPMPTHAYDRT